MKRIFYMALMMIFFILLSYFLYLSIVFILVYHRMIPLEYIIRFTDITLSLETYSLVGVVGTMVGYFSGKYWWQIIYVDGVYRFHKKTFFEKCKNIFHIGT